MKTARDIFSPKELKKGVTLALKITLILGVFFFIVSGSYSVKNFLLAIAVSALYSFLLGFFSGIINDFLSVKWNWVTQTNERVWAGIIATVLYTVPVVLLINYVVFVKLNGMNPESFFTPRAIWMHLFWIVLALGVSAFLHAREFMRAWKSSVKQETTEQKIVAKTETAKFETLKSQLDPHFLFNSLNVLTSLIGENPAQAEKFTTKLSKIYRYVLEQRNKDLVPIQEELQFAKTYMELLQMRFEDALEFSLPAKVSNDLKVVPLSLQLLLENAVKHNVVSSTKPLKIDIYEKDGFLKISNNINPKEAIGKSTKVGLQNIADRYGLITKAPVEIINTKKIFTVSLPLLTQTNSIMKTTEQLENSKYVRALERVEKMKEFYQNLVTYLIMVPVFIYVNLTFVPHFHWFWFPILGWGFGVVFHGLEAFNYNIFLGKNWEDRKIKELMDNDKNKY